MMKTTSNSMEALSKGLVIDQSNQTIWFYVHHKCQILNFAVLNPRSQITSEDSSTR